VDVRLSREMRLIDVTMIGEPSIGVAFAIAAGVGSSQAIRQAWEQVFEKHRPPKKED
jgi:hypothetical protein